MDERTTLGDEEIQTADGTSPRAEVGDADVDDTDADTDDTDADADDTDA